MGSSQHSRTIWSIDPDTARTSDGLVYIKDGKFVEHPSSLCRHVAAYVRVSTDLDKQKTSFINQVAHYFEYIKNHPRWKLVKIYADRGFSGTSYKHRPEFNQMIKDAKDGKFDLIITKSISRFGRNVTDVLQVTRELKAHDVEVIFEKENISSFDAKTELVFSILASVAQEESRSISENIKWRIERDKEAGKIYCPYKIFIGYKKGEDGYPEIVKEEARTIRMIFQMFLDGETYGEIAKRLTSEGIFTPRRRLNWSADSVKAILTNEKYRGDARLGKTFTENYLTKKVKKNRGERKQYYVREAHDPIIPPEIFDEVQRQIEGRRHNKTMSTKNGGVKTND